MSKINFVKILFITVFLVSCSNKSSDTTVAITGQALNAYQTFVSTITSPFGGSCDKVIRDTTSCQNARTALGLSVNWLSFSCNVVLGLATSALAPTTNYASAAYVTVTFYNLPDHTSNYFPTTGSYSFTANGTTIAGNYSSMYVAYTPSYPDPGINAQQTTTMNIPISPSFSGSQVMPGGSIGVAINGVGIFSDVAASTDNIFTESKSFDTCQGHPAGTKYHYHSEPFSISSDDNNLIGIMRDGFWVYGRKDFSGATPGTTANLQTAGASSTIYKFGGHTGADPLTNSGSAFHYHLTEWVGCYHETTGGTKSADDGITNDTINTGLTPSCGGTWIDAWFTTGHGNGGVFKTIPTGLSSQSPSQTTSAIRYYYGTPGTCTGC